MPMTEPRQGRRLPLSPARRMVLELLHHARRVPSLPLAQTMHLPELVAARQAACPTPSWIALFMRAYGLVAQQHPVLRQAYLPYPRPHLYEHPHSVCAVLVEREWEGEPVVLGTKIRGPETQTLEDIDRYLKRYREAPVESIPAFRQILRFGRLPWLVRRFTFWHSLYLSGCTRAKRFGTFAISSLGNLGVEQFHPLTPLTTYLTFGPISPDGEVTVKIIYDHRVMDGRTVARCLNDLESVLKRDLVANLAASAVAA
jgi:hypothetical protein